MKLFENNKDGKVIDEVEYMQLKAELAKHWEDKKEEREKTHTTKLWRKNNE